MLTRNKKKLLGQSLLEAMIVVALVGIAVVTLIRSFTTSTSNARRVKERTQAEGYAKEAVEWLGYHRDLDWDEFAAKIGATYCLAELPELMDDWPEAGTCELSAFIKENDGSATIYKRSVLLSADPNVAGGVEAEVKVWWPGSPDENEFVIVKTFTDWR